jgi:pyruvate/2-oxoglutarate dehydrogenase complex dihydrolipoamide acyltransferase (E2) component
MATATEEKSQEQVDAEKAEAAAAKKAEKERKAKEKAEADAARKAEREQEKARKAQEKAEAKAKADREKVEALAKENELDLSTVKGTGEGDTVTLRDVRDAVKAKKAEERANRPKKAPLTLSQRRAVLKLASGALRPTTDMNRTPLEYLVSVGLAKVEEVLQDVEVDVPNPKAGEDGEPKTVKETKSQSVREYSLTDEGVARAKEINPKWETWKPAA